MRIPVEKRVLPYFQRATLVVADLEKAFAIYRDLLGFAVENVGVDTPDSYSYGIFHIPRNIQTRFATLSSVNQQRTLALIEAPNFNLENKKTSLSAIVVQVADTREILARVEKLGLKTYEPLTVGAAGIYPARTEAAFHDFDNHLVVVYNLEKQSPSIHKQGLISAELPSEMKQWTLASRPKGVATEENFRLETVNLPEISDGQILVETLYLGVAPVMLRYMTNETAFEKPLEIGDVMHGRGVGRVIASKNTKFAVGEIVQAKLGWREFAAIDGDNPYFMIYKMQNTDLPLSYGISTLAMSGFTALIGMREICQVKEKDKVLVSGAAGGVGSQAGFVAKCLGAKYVVGIAGGAEKCRILTEKLGYDAAIDYKNEAVAEKLDVLFPEGIDVFFDNVGGELLDEVMGKIRRRGRIAICGRISEYLKSPAEYHRHRNLYRIGLQDAKLEAFFVYDYEARFAEFEQQLATWIREGKLIPQEDILDGIEKMPEALISLYKGDNIGVRMVKIKSEI